MVNFQDDSEGDDFDPEGEDEEEDAVEVIEDDGSSPVRGTKRKLEEGEEEEEDD